MNDFDYLLDKKCCRKIISNMLENNDSEMNIENYIKILEFSYNEDFDDLVNIKLSNDSFYYEDEFKSLKEILDKKNPSKKKNK